MFIAYHSQALQGISPPEHPACLYNIATKDLVTDEIQVSLLNAKELGRQQMKEFAEQRLPSVSQQQQDRSSEVRFWDTMHKNNAPTINNLYQVVKSSKEKNKTTILRADRKCPSTPYHCLCSGAQS